MRFQRSFASHGWRAARSKPVRASARAFGCAARTREGSAAAATSAAATAAAVAVFAGIAGASSSLVECKKSDDSSAAHESAVADYEQRLWRLTSLPRVFEAYSTVEIGGERFMTAGDFMRAMLCYRFTKVDPKDLRRRCGRYSNALLGDDRGLISLSEFVFLVELLNIPEEFFHVALAALDGDGNGTIDRAELEALVGRLLQPTDAAEGSGGLFASRTGAKPRDAAGSTPPPRASERLTREWFGADGSGCVCGEEVENFVRSLARDVRMAEFRLYSRVAPAPQEGRVLKRNSGLLSWLWPWRSGGQEAQREQLETLSMGDLALTLVSSSDPKRLPVLLERVAAVRRRRQQVQLDEALELHDALESRSEDLAYALSLFSSVSGGGVGTEDFARAVRIVTGIELRTELVEMIFDIFDEEKDGHLGVKELVDALKTRSARRLGTRQRPPGLGRFVKCVKAGGP